ncbi:hypothetical protein TrVE_jg13580 [Triparma verrucosa]|uniref:Cilia- and flagella-associated protein 157 n=1 Tax=Triparma verrucosa TaxID=1606542 RepID=A0A9W7EWR4_9STRA|nr:hypothetical protein TrVE_jg13580 [Triparma verrucosa]
MAEQDAEIDEAASERKEALELSATVQDELLDDQYNTMIEQLLAEEEACTKNTMGYMAKLDQLRSDQEEANTYLNNKIEDNYVVIAELEEKIIKEQEDRRKKEFELINETVGKKEKFAIRLTSLQHELEEKENDFKVISEFMTSQAGTQEHLETIRAQLESQKIKHAQAREEFGKKLEADLVALKAEWATKLNETRDALSLMTEDALNKNTRRIMMETEKMEHEMKYQDAEVVKLKKSTERGKAINSSLLAQKRDAQVLETSAAKKAHMYNRIISKLKSKIEKKISEIEAVRRADEQKGEGRKSVKDRLNARVKALVGEIRATHAEKTKLIEVAETANQKISLMKSCQTALVSSMLDSVSDFYDGATLGWGDNGNGDGNYDGGDGGYEGIEVDDDRHAMHRGYTEDLIGDEDGDEAEEDVFKGEDEAFGRKPCMLDDGNDQIQRPKESRPRAETLLEEERRMIGNIVGDDTELRQLFGIQDDKPDDISSVGYSTNEEGNEEFTSIRDLPVDHRMKYLRMFLAKVHNFQLGTGLSSSGEDDKESVTLPKIDGTNKPNILTSLLGGNINIQGGFFNTKKPKPQTFEVDTQTDDLELTSKSTFSGLTLNLSKSDLIERRKLHRGINSPGYAYSDIISVDAKGELWKKYTPAPKSSYSGTGDKVEDSVPHEHRGRVVDKPPTPEIKGWAVDPLSGKKKKGRKVNKTWKGNPKVLEVREEIKRREREDHKRNIMKAAGLI